MNLKYVEKTRVKGRTYYYFRRGKVRHRLPDPDDPTFAAEYQRLLGERQPRGKYASGTLGDLILQYRQSPEFRELSETTQQNRERYFRMLLDRFGNEWVSQLTRANVKKLRDSMADKPGNANNYVAILSVLMEYAIDMELRATNPCHGIKRLKLQGIPPWPENVLQAAFLNASPMMYLTLCLHLYSGQRIGDCVRMTHHDRKDGYIRVVQSKTGKELWIKEHRDLTEAIDRTPRKAVTILYNRFGRPFSTKTLQDQLREYMRRIGYAGYTMHGLRKNAVIALLQAGNSVAKVAAVTGQTYQMVEHYAARIDQKEMGTAAILAWENAE